MEAAVSPLPDDAEALEALLTPALQKAEEAEQHAAAIEAEFVNARALAIATEALIAHLKLQNAKLRREQYGASAERTERLLAQFELGYDHLEADAGGRTGHRSRRSEDDGHCCVRAQEAGQEAIPRTFVTRTRDRHARTRPAAATVCPSSART